MSFLQIPIGTYPNTFLGYQSSIGITTGTGDTAFGYLTLNANTTGSDNSAFGSEALRFNVSGSRNTAGGANALLINNANNNTAFGYASQRGNVNGQDNSSFGHDSMRVGDDGNENSAFGSGALYNAANTQGNSGFGYLSLYNVTSGLKNSAFGWASGSLITTGSKNSILGSYSGNQGGLDIRTLSNHIVLSDGDGNPRLWINASGAVNIPGGLALTGSLSITGGTVTANNPVLSATQTWNNAAVTFTGWQLNVTDTASAAGSLLMDLQVGGATQFNVSKSGRIGIRGIFGVAGVGGIKDRLGGGGGMSFYNGSSVWGVVSNSGFRFKNGIEFDRADPDSGNSIDATIQCEAPQVLAQRNGVNAQTLRVYNTFTDASNYERGRFAWVSNVLTIGTENAGTGLARNLTIESAGGQLSFSSSSSIQLQVNGRAFISHAAGASTLNFGGVTAGPANIDTIAIFTNNAQRWTFNNSGHFVAFADNTYDIGSTGANRPRNVFWAGYQEMSEMTAPAAPAANSVRIYAEDNGSGKTRLMALFATGAAQQIAIEP